MPHGSMAVVAALLLTLLIGAAGCTGTQSLGPDSTESSGMVQDQARQTDEAQQVSSQGKAPYLAEFRVRDEQGTTDNLRVTATGPQTSLQSELVDLSSPKDVEIEALTLWVPGPDGELRRKIKLEGLSASASDPISAYNEQVEQIAAATENMTDAQREQVLAGVEAIRDVAPELAGQIIQAIKGVP